MRELDALAFADEHHRVLTGAVAAAQGLDRDGAFWARADVAGALEQEVFAECLRPALRDGFG
jgi:hypothetical protein